MKLKSGQVKEVLAQLDAKVIPADHPAVPQLEATFGAHTFFLGAEGLHVVERATAEGEDPDGAYILKVAGWSDDKKSALQPQQAELAGSVELGFDDGKSTSH